jgi:anionic cell wall polymer biosynthesis LytR-Cps2A-Psr (LCP) family protein
MQEVAQLIDVMGGLSIEIPTAFTDTEFPRTDVDVTKERDPAKLYQTVTFAAGPQTLSGQRVLQYIRSRHSGDTQGTDIARAERQQLVIKSLISQLKHPNFYLTHLAETGQLYRFYLDHFTDILGPTELVALGKQLLFSGAPIRFQAATPSIFPDSPTGVITHPQNLKPYQNQWVYVVKDLPGLQMEVARALGVDSASSTDSATEVKQLKK